MGRMGWTANEYDHNKNTFQNFCELEGLDADDFEIWRYKGDKDIHFAMRTADGQLFTAIAYTNVSRDHDNKDELWFSAKVVDMSMGFVEPLHPQVQKYFDNHVGAEA
jgi:hypothetical protein